MLTHTRKNRFLPLLAAALLGCEADAPTSPSAPRLPQPAFAIVDGAHGGGNAHFYFLPPLVSAPAFAGSFDGTQQPVVEICPVRHAICAGPPLASFSTTAGGGSEIVRVDARDELYIVNWHTKGTPAYDIYRITVKVGSTVLGYLDVSLRQAKAGNLSGDALAWPGGTVPIKFRIEDGALPPAKPVWKFTILGAVSKATADYLGGFDAAVRLMRRQIDSVNSRFNTPNVFAAEVRFSLDSVYVYTGTGWDAILQAHPGFDYKYIVDGYQGPGGWLGDWDTVFLSWPIADITSAYATDAIVHEFGHARGAIDLYAIKADAEFNPVNGAAYHAGRSIMEYPYGETLWDRHSINLINRSANVVHAPPNYILDAFPSSIGIIVSDAAGVPQANATVKLYAVPWFQNRVVPDPRFTVSTNNQGEYVFGQNPYDPWTSNSPWLMSYPNYLVIATAGALSGYAWMPVTDVQNSWFADPTAPYRLRITVRPSP